MAHYDITPDDIIADTLYSVLLFDESREYEDVTELGVGHNGVTRALFTLIEEFLRLDSAWTRDRDYEFKMNTFPGAEMIDEAQMMRRRVAFFTDVVQNHTLNTVSADTAITVDERIADLFPGVDTMDALHLFHGFLSNIPEYSVELSAPHIHR